MFWVFLFFLALIAILAVGARSGYRRIRPQASAQAGTHGRHDDDDSRSNLPAPLAAVLGFFNRPAGVVAVSLFVMFVSFWMTSVVNPGGTQIAQFERIYLCSTIEGSRNIALPGECGRQSEVVMPGFHVMWFAGVLNNVSYTEMVDVPDGHYAVLNARDGAKLDEGQVAAKPWPLGDITTTKKGSDGKDVRLSGNMLDATFFLTSGLGQKGPQATILPPGRYPINSFLWDVETDHKVEASSKEERGFDGLTKKYVRQSIPTGYVGVVRSALDEPSRPSFVSQTASANNCGKSMGKNTQQLRTLLVSVGHRGVWDEALPPGDYYINKRVYDVELHDTRMQNLVLAGGYTRRVIDLEVDDKGGIKQIVHEEKIDQPPNAAGPAVPVKTEGWTVWQEARIQFRTRPECAPLQAAGLGTLKEVEDRIIVPQTISVVRNVGGSNITVKNTTAYEEAKSELGALQARLAVLKDANTDVGLSAEQRAQETATLEKQISGFQLPDPNREVTRPTRVLDFQNERVALETLVAGAIQKIGDEAGTEIDSVTFGNPDLPPELLVARKVEQLSGQLRNAYTQMRTAQVQRQATEAARARADKQEQLVTQQIDTEKSKLKIEQRTNEGRAEQLYNEADAKGQQAQVNVLGADKVMMLRVVDMALKSLEKNPEILGSVKLPGTMVFGDSGFNGPAAILRGVFPGTGNEAPASPRVQGTTAQR